MSEQNKQAKRKRRRAKSGSEPYVVTRALTHIRLGEVNQVKLDALDALAPVYLSLCQQYVALFCECEVPNKLRAPCFTTELSGRWHRVVIMQAAGVAKSWRSNRATTYQDYLDQHAADQAQCC